MIPPSASTAHPDNIARGSDGLVVHDLSTDPTAHHMVTGVREHEGRVWLGSLEESAVAVLDRGSAHGKIL